MKSIFHVLLERANEDEIELPIQADIVDAFSAGEFGPVTLTVQCPFEIYKSNCKGKVFWFNRSGEGHVEMRKVKIKMIPDDWEYPDNARFIRTVLIEQPEEWGEKSSPAVVHVLEIPSEEVGSLG